MRMNAYIYIHTYTHTHIHTYTHTHRHTDTHTQQKPYTQKQTHIHRSVRMCAYICVLMCRCADNTRANTVEFKVFQVHRRTERESYA